MTDAPPHSTSRPPWWNQAVELQDTLPLREIAERVGGSVEEVVRALLEAGGGVRARSPQRPSPPQTPDRGRAPVAGSAKAPVPMEALRGLLGHVPDRVLADFANVSIPTVRNHRLRYDIPPAGRMDPAEIQRRVQRWRAEQGPSHALLGPPAANSSAVPANDGSLARAWRVSFHGQPGCEVVVARSLPDVVAALHRQGRPSQPVRSVEDLGEVLASE